MQESARAIYSILMSTDLSRGLFMGEELIGYALFEKADILKTVYLYDIAVLPKFQHKGLGTTLAREALAASRRRGLKVRMHVRSTSYPLFANSDKMRSAGYRVARKTFVPDFYFGEFGVHEDAHELVLYPLVHSAITTAKTAGECRDSLTGLSRAAVPCGDPGMTASRISLKTLMRRAHTTLRPAR